MRSVMSMLPYALPILGGLLGVVYVNMNRSDFINPFFAIAIGVIVGRLVAWAIQGIAGRSR
ncbi:hypothetical protein KUH32_15685 [Thalassococcus sp. CAU 1522]|uniref:Uncharacterized protein n=1 Tax=Thalassococcus arenae TaxID=2851652 RepID=A0ABS6NB23_9RHOB|nr:hypothetical protein [Thalassococcus arenae]MBV2361205.1 hypothetical protein [Thalassococcus arenae]